MGSGTLSNAQCTLDLAASSVTSSGNELTMALRVGLGTAFAGPKSLYMLATSPGVNTNWQQRGTWTVPMPEVSAISVTPNAGSGITQAFTLHYGNVYGAADLSARVRFGASNTGPGTCTARYNVATAVVELQNDAGTTWTAGTMGSGSLSNSQCTLNLASSSATANGTDLTLVLNITFSTSFTGQKQIYMLATTPTGLSTGWQQRGTWRVPLLPLPTALLMDRWLGAGLRELRPGLPAHAGLTGLAESRGHSRSGLLLQRLDWVVPRCEDHQHTSEHGGGLCGDVHPAGATTIEYPALLEQPGGRLRRPWQA
jgi:hypothetical protein